MRIQQLAQRTGFTIDTIRFYEKCGLLNHSHFQRSENGYRSYSEDAVERLAMIKRAQAAGFTLSEIYDLFALWERNQLSDAHIVAHLHEKRLHIAEKIADLEQIGRYIAEKIKFYEDIPANTKPSELESRRA